MRIMVMTNIGFIAFGIWLRGKKAIFHNLYPIVFSVGG